MKISMKSQAVLKRGKKKSEIAFVVLSFLCHKKTFKLQEYQKKFSSKRLCFARHCTRAHYWCLSEFSWFV